MCILCYVSSVFFLLLKIIFWIKIVSIDIYNILILDIFFYDRIILFIEKFIFLIRFCKYIIYDLKLNLFFLLGLLVVGGIFEYVECGVKFGFRM